MASHSELALTVQWIKERMVFFNTSKTKLETYYHCRVGNQSEPNLKDVPGSERLLSLLPTTDETHIFVSLQKIQEEWSVH